MTRKDYQLIAQAICEAREHDWATNEYNNGIDVAVYRLADWLTAENAGFNRTKFLEACKAPTP